MPSAVVRAKDCQLCPERRGTNWADGPQSSLGTFWGRSLSYGMLRYEPGVILNTPSTLITRALAEDLLKRARRRLGGRMTRTCGEPGRSRRRDPAALKGDAQTDESNSPNGTDPDLVFFRAALA